MNVSEFTIWMPGPPVPRREPQLQISQKKGAGVGLPKGAVWRKMIWPSPYPDPKTEAGMARWRRAWLDHPDRPFIEGWVVAELDGWISRPQSHFRADGIRLSPAGEEWPFPPRIDSDNLVKLALDALKGRAFEDDRFVQSERGDKFWASRQQPEGTRLVVRRIEIPDLGERLFD